MLASASAISTTAAAATAAVAAATAAAATTSVAAAAAAAITAATASLATTASAAGLSGADGRLLGLPVRVDLLHGETDAAVVLDVEDLDLDGVADVHDVLGVADEARGHLRDVAQALGPRQHLMKARRGLMEVTRPS